MAKQTENKHNAINSEEEFLGLIDRFFPPQHRNLILGRGDDGAIIPCQEALCVSSDLFLEGIHFRRQYFRASDIAYKALAVNISDISAMGARPFGFMLNLMIPQDLEQGFWSEFFKSLAELASAYDLALVGGDLSRAPVLGVDIAIWGSGQGRFLQRRQCCPGDILFLIGDIGLARTGLLVLEKGEDAANYPESVKAHLRPALYVHQAEQLVDQKHVCGLMDVSDGLVQDLPRFLGTDLGADISLQPDNLNSELIGYCRKHSLAPLEFALQGGEDYALLGCVHPQGVKGLKSLLPEIVILGRVCRVPGLFLSGTPFHSAGFDHLST